MLPAYARFFSNYLEGSWHEINQTAFQGQLRLPLLQIDESTRRLGFWEQATRTLAIASHLLLHHSEVEIQDVLKHEMAHQYADEVLGLGEDDSETPHGSRFRHAASRLGIQHHARYAAHQEASPILRKIQKLLALTQSENPHESQAAMLKAQALMVRFELDTGWEQREFFHRYLGNPISRKSLQQQLVSTILVRFFSVSAIWIPSTMVLKNQNVWMLEISGTPPNLEIANYVHEFLHRELRDLWHRHRARNPLLKGMRPKRDYQVGVLRGLIEKLSDQQGQPTEPQRALILQKQTRLDEFLRKRHPDMQSGRRMAYRKSETFQAGLEEGRQLEIHKGLGHRPAGSRKISSG